MLSTQPANKKQKTANQSTTEEEEDEKDSMSWKQWSLSRFKKHETENQYRRAREIDSSITENSPPPRGDDMRDWKMHWRRGMIGCIQDWAEGSKFRVAFVLAGMAEYFGVQTDVAARMGLTLTKEEVEHLKVNSYIVKRLREALSQLKQCRSEEECSDNHTVLTALAPKREAVGGDKSGMVSKVCERLGVARGARYIKSTGEKRLRVFDQSVNRRKRFDAAASVSRTLQPGDAATSRGRHCVVVKIDYDVDPCKLVFTEGGVEVIRDFTCIYKGVGAPVKAPLPKGSARLRRAPPSLRPETRETRSDATVEAARPKIVELFDAEGARSPLQRNRLRRRLGVCIYETAQAL